MARTNIEDCLKSLPERNRFALVSLATRRARQLYSSNVQCLVPDENEKPTVLALREIAADVIDDEVLERGDSLASSIEAEAERQRIFVADDRDDPL